jgi:hypothetical protein
MKIEVITTENKLNDSSVLTDGHYKIKKHGHSFEYEGVIYTYHGSGLARTVYRSDCGEFVIKVPNGGYFEDAEELKEALENNFRYSDCTIHHNLGEAKAYEDAPEEYKIFLAKTELLPNCWVKQEYVEVKTCSFTGMHDLREIGKRKDGTYCIFDYDPLLDDFEWNGHCNWERIKSLVTRIQDQIETDKNPFNVPYKI